MSSSEAVLLSKYDAGVAATKWYRAVDNTLPDNNSLSASIILIDYIERGLYGDLIPTATRNDIDTTITITQNKENTLEVLRNYSFQSPLQYIPPKTPSSSTATRNQTNTVISDRKPPKNPCYFYTSVLPGKYFILPVVPDSISDTTSSQWTPQDIMGRSAPLAAYGYTSARNTGFSFDISRDPAENEFAGGNEFSEDIDILLNALRSTAYPLYDNQSGMIPPVTTFRMYDFRSTGYVTNVGFDWKRPILRTNGYNEPTKFGYVTVQISMTEIVKGVPSGDFSSDPPNPFDTSLSSLFERYNA